MTQHITSKSNTKELYVKIGKRLKQIRLNKGIHSRRIFGNNRN